MKSTETTEITYIPEDSYFTRVSLTPQWKINSGEAFLYFMFHTRTTPSGSLGDSGLALYEATISSGYCFGRGAGGVSVISSGYWVSIV